MQQHCCYGLLLIVLLFKFSLGFICKDGQRIADDFRCNGQINCLADNSDEEECCQIEDSFQCAPDGKCVDQRHICNGFYNCRDKSDERNCSNRYSLDCQKPDHVRCQVGTIGKCIPLSYICDGFDDCPSGIDEFNCPSSCTGWFPCENGEWICENKLCDGNFDCPGEDQSDERWCPVSLDNQENFTEFCGVQSPKTKIFNGREAFSGQFPWMVHLSINYTDGDENGRCGGSLVSDQWILTAAHCFEELYSTIDSIEIQIGRSNLSNSNENFLTFAPDEIHSHPCFVGLQDLWNFDFALVKLPRKINFLNSSKIRPICLPSSENECQQSTTSESNGIDSCFVGEIAGWGVTRGNGDPSEVLQTGNLTIAPRSTCDQYHRSDLSEAQICANGDSNICIGDSGSPLMCRRRRGGGNGTGYYQIGISSWGGSFCGQGPPVFSRFVFL